MEKWIEFCKLKGNEISDKYYNMGLGMQTKDLINAGKQLIKYPRSAILIGGKGRGKTCFAYEMARQIVNREGLDAVVLRKSKKLGDEFRDEYEQWGSARTLIDRLCEAKYLFIDDLGSESHVKNLLNDYYEIIDTRWERMTTKTTIITTNLTPEKINEMYGERVLSRFKDFQWLKFEGPDLRGQEGDV